MSQVSYASSQLADTPYDSAVDLYAPGGTLLHTVPLCSGNGCCAVCQFVCPERDRSSAMVDDGTYHQENRSHYRLLMVLLNFVQRHVAVFDQKTTSRGPSKAEVESQNGSIDGEALDMRHKKDAKLNS